ncbi:tungsten formylmethanofuran dehydrogenase [Niastella koreensis]|uniref:3-methyl-2-oxobutanoate dehydrogenase (2-methylpropanoyl-transferring) n=2 Tax=Niastella koreensis TaxID=354356 RepID=G8TLL5_NIAKG|nr:thiamine pyrophosphate-dependent enzyme [Niastella koreensis]AEV96584.1 Pyruvate dehydrogenase (acetyl-transferring), 3-methyl-2-oxobutanoate dehydrogenase (2-methylpropanoyl-transferring) [Niastella koreensis GR20-10]OQP54099.1 tungsten formylmethanofuran dehydrogenase [Niastella koreensis]
MMHTDTLLKAYRLMCTAKAMADTYEANRAICKYVHSTSRGHEAIQLAAAFQLLPCDYISPYYRDESILLGLGFSPYQLMLQLLAKRDDIFTGGREYYSHPNYRGADKPAIIHQSSATGMQAIPTTGVAQGIQYLEQINSDKLIKGPGGELPVVICSLGDASVTEGEVSEAFQFAILKKLPVIYLVQDNNWGISATSDEVRVMDAYDYAAGFPGLDRVRIDGSNFEESFDAMHRVVQYVRQHRTPYLVQAKVPLLGHHTSGVRREFYRTPDDLEKHAVNDPLPRLRLRLLQLGVDSQQLQSIEKEAWAAVNEQFQKAAEAPEPDPATVTDHVFVPTPVTREQGQRQPAGNEKIIMVDAALFAIREIMEDYPEAMLYGQDVGRRLGGVFREAATLAEKFSDTRVFNTAIQEAYIIGSTVGMSAVGVKPIVEVQFADYIYPGFNQLVTEISKSSYLTCGKFPVATVIRVPVGAYGGGGPYHSGSIETTLLSIKGIKVVYPSNAADMKGLMKAAFLDPNPVVMLEHKGLYWSKVPGTEDAKTIEPSRDYVLPLGKAALALKADDTHITNGESCCVITYGMGVYWARAAAKNFPGQVDVIDLRTLYPLDEALIFERVKKHGKCLVLTEEQQNNSFAEALAGRISYACFQWLDAPVTVMGALNVPAVPMNMQLEQAMLPNSEKVAATIKQLLRS